MEIKRDLYLNKLIEKKNNGLVKIITGLRRCGKSYLLFEIYHHYLNDQGIDDSQIIELSLDDISNIQYRNPIELNQYIRSLITEDKAYYIFLDEIQFVSEISNPYVDNDKDKITFVDVLLGLMKIKNVDVYVTGSNSKMLSSDILTQFRGKGDEIRVHPLSYKEFYDAFNDHQHAFREYITFGGMPYLLNLNTPKQKSEYLKDLFSKIYFSDIFERNNIQKDKEVLETLLNIIASSIGSLTNPKKLENTFKSVAQLDIHRDTIAKYLDYFIDAFILDKAYRYNIKRKNYINTPLKYYFSDIGLRNARINFRQNELNHIMENIIYNELLIRGYNVDIGVIEYNYKDENNKSKKSLLEVDFIVNTSMNKFYIQSALTVNDEDKRQQEIKSLLKVDDSFKKIVIVGDDIIPYHDDHGILYIGIETFLLDYSAIDL